MYRLLLAIALFATVSHGLPTNATTRTATEAYVTNRLAQAIATHNTNSTAHVGIFLSVSWQPAWTNIVGLPSTFTPSAHVHGYTVITNAPWLTVQTQQVFTATKLWATNGNTFVTVDGTNVDVWGISVGVATNLWITYDEGFSLTMDDVTYYPPAPSVFPFSDNGDGWTGVITESYYYLGHVISWQSLGLGVPTIMFCGAPGAVGVAYLDYTNMVVLVTNHLARLASTNDLPTWATLAGKPASFTPEAHSHAWESITNPPASIATALQPADIIGLVTAAQIPQYTAQGWLTHSNLTGSVTITNAYEAPVSLVGTGAVSIAFESLRAPYPVYVTAQGFSSLVFPANTYLVGGGSWQTNRINHFIVWLYSTNLYVTPLITTEL
jgi:hypothetical protein